jgi:hypothetical protein
VVILVTVYFLAKRFSPVLQKKIEGVLRMIFFNIIITAFMKAYLRVALSSSEKSMKVLAGNIFNEQEDATQSN